MEYMEGSLSLYENMPKRNLILFPHRMAPEKQPAIFQDLKKAMPQYEFVVCSVTTLILSLTRIFGMVYSGKTRFRNRVLAISTGTIILTLPVEYDGLKVIIAIMTSFLAEKISRSAPVKMGLWDPHANID